MDIKVQIPHHKQLSQAFLLAPKRTVREMNMAMRASLLSIQQRQVDKYFQFKTPRSRRTGMLQRMFQLNTATAVQALVSKKDALYTEIYSTVRYADWVASKNNYYKRILDASQLDVRKHYARAVENIIGSLKI